MINSIKYSVIPPNVPTSSRGRAVSFENKNNNQEIKCNAKADFTKKN